MGFVLSERSVVEGMEVAGQHKLVRIFVHVITVMLWKRIGGRERRRGRYMEGRILSETLSK